MQGIGLLCHLIYSTTPLPPPKKIKKCPTPSKFLTLLNKHNPIHPDYNNLRSTTPPPPPNTLTPPSQYIHSLTLSPPQKNFSTHQNDFPLPTNN